MSPGAAARHFKASEKAVIKNVTASERQTVKDAKRQAIIFSNGGISTAALRKAGHPFSRRAPNSAYDPGLINSQGGIFKSSFVISAPVVTSSGIVSHVVNVDPKSAFLAGTKTMIARPLAAKVQAAVQPARVKRAQEAVAKSFYRP